MVSTIDGQRMSDTTHAKRTMAIVRRKLGAAYPACMFDETHLRYAFSERQSPQLTAAHILACRESQLAAAARIPCKVWRDEFDGDIRVGPAVPEAVAVTIRAAFAAGLTHGTVTHWTERMVSYNRTGDIGPELYLWEAL